MTDGVLSGKSALCDQLSCVVESPKTKSWNHHHRGYTIHKNDVQQYILYCCQLIVVHHTEVQQARCFGRFKMWARGASKLILHQRISGSSFRAGAPAYCRLFPFASVVGGGRVVLRPTNAMCHTEYFLCTREAIHTAVLYFVVIVYSSSAAR